MGLLERLRNELLTWRGGEAADSSCTLRLLWLPKRCELFLLLKKKSTFRALVVHSMFSKNPRPGDAVGLLLAELNVLEGTRLGKWLKLALILLLLVPGREDV